MIRVIEENDYEQLMQLYLHLHEKEIPDFDLAAGVWNEIVSDPNYHIIVAEADGKLVSTCTCVIIPNLTHGLRPYAWVENVVTLPEYRGKGWASDCLKFAAIIARMNNCYKMVLMTGCKDEATLNFYKSAGFNSSDKTGFVRWLDKEPPHKCSPDCGS